MSEVSNATGSPWLIMLFPRFPSRVQIPLSIFGRPASGKSDWARFPDEDAAKEEMGRIEQAIKDGRDSIPNRRYDLNDTKNILKRFYMKPHAWK